MRLTPKTRLTAQLREKVLRGATAHCIDPSIRRLPDGRVIVVGRDVEAPNLWAAAEATEVEDGGVWFADVLTGRPTRKGVLQAIFERGGSR